MPSSGSACHSVGRKQLEAYSAVVESRRMDGAASRVTSGSIIIETAERTEPSCEERMAGRCSATFDAQSQERVKKEAMRNGVAQVTATTTFADTPISLTEITSDDLEKSCSYHAL